ncbi:hypothetical protein MN608_09764 [Microdochium nivale]|nr:hypothetical protein MN608_09764 [Microdochium nivale]
MRIDCRDCEHMARCQHNKRRPSPASRHGLNVCSASCLPPPAISVSRTTQTQPQLGSLYTLYTLYTARARLLDDITPRLVLCFSVFLPVPYSSPETMAAMMNYTEACALAPPSVPSDAGVAGIGVLLSFMITAAVSLILSMSLVFEDIRNKDSNSTLRRRLLNSYSDQQILTGIGIQGVGLAKMSTMVPYHFFIIWMLSVLSTAVHNAALLALARDFRRDPVLRWLRQVLMAVNLLLSCAYGVFVLEAVQDGLNDSTLPIACVWSPSPVDPAAIAPPSKSTAGSFVGTIVIIAANVLVFGFSTYYLHSRTQRYYKLIQIVGLVSMTGIAIGSTVRIILMAQAFQTNPPIRLSDAGERVWSFGQLLSVGLLLLPIVSIIEIMRGELQCAPPVPDDDAKEALLDKESSGEEGSAGEELQETK